MPDRNVLRSRVTVLAVGVIVGLTGCGGASGDATGSSGARTTPSKQDVSASSTASSEKLDADAYVNDEEGFRIRPPEEWQVNEGGQGGTAVILMEPDPGNFGANVNVAVSQTPADLAGVVEATKKQSSQLFQDYELQAEEQVQTDSGQQAHLLSSTFTQGQFQLRNFQLLLVEGGTMYAVTGTAQQANWEEYRDRLRSSLLTFETR